MKINEILQSRIHDILNSPNYIYTENLEGLGLSKAIQHKMIERGTPLSGKRIQKLIRGGDVKLNNEICKMPHKKLQIEDKVEFENLIFTVSSKNIFDILCELINSKRGPLKISNIFKDQLSREEAQLIIATLIRILEASENHEYPDLHFHNEIVTFFDNYLSRFYKHLTPYELRYSFKKIEAILQVKHEIEQQLDDLFGLIDKSHLLKFHHRFKQILFKPASKFFILPFFPHEFVDVANLDGLFKLIKDILEANTNSQKLEIYNINLKYFEDFFSNIKDTKLGYTKKYILPFIENLNKILKSEIYDQVTETADINIKQVEKKYPFHTGKEFDILIELKNSGPGFAKTIKISPESDILIINKKFNPIVNNFSPGSRTVPIPVNIDDKITVDKAELIISVEWENFDGSINKRRFNLFIEAQERNIPWEEIKARNPYVLKAIEEKEKLLGRDEIITELSNNINSDFINSFILYGQKRVGKTSIVKTIQNLFNQDLHKSISIAYVDGTSIRQPLAEETINEIGHKLMRNLKRNIANKFRENEVIYKNINSLQIPSFSKSISPISLFIEEVLRILPELKIVLIIDEFDELQYEIYKPGDLSDTFFRNFRGLNNEFDNLGFILVGAENMPKIYNWHGEQLNNWKNRAVDVFDSSQFEDFKNIVKKPLEPNVKYYDDAISYIYELSGGNPYFSNMICGWAFTVAFQKRDNEITVRDIREALDLKLKKEAKTSFQHFWKDGILDTPSQKDLISDYRRRALLAISKALNKNATKSMVIPVRINEIEKYFTSPQEIELQTNLCRTQINEFMIRNIINETQYGFRLNPLVFEEWIMHFGEQEIIKGIADLETIQQHQQIENLNYIKDEELNLMVEKFKNYQGKKLNQEQIRNWLKQFGENTKQRIIYEVLRKSAYYSKDQLLSLYRNAKSKIFKGDDIYIKENKKLYRENAIIGLPNYNFEESELITRYFTEVSFIKTTYIKKLGTIFNYVTPDIKFLIISMPFLCMYELLDEIEQFYQKLIKNDLNVNVNELEIIVLSILASKEILIRIKEKFDKVNVNIKIVVLEDVKITDVECFSDESTFFDNSWKRYEAFDLIHNVTKIGTSKSSLAIILEPICPQISLPIFWYSDENWNALFPNHLNIYIKDINKDKNDDYELKIKTKRLGDQLEQKMLDIAQEALIRKHGKENWWINGIPEDVRKSCMGRWDQEKRIECEWNYLDFIHYAKIAIKNQELRQYFFYEEGKRWDQIGREKGTKWLSDLNEIRKIYSHPIRKRKIKDKDFNYMKKMKEWFVNNAEKNNTI